MKSYLVVGSAITNRLIFTDGRVVEDILGGGIYALEGVRLYTDDVTFVASVGEDYDQYYGEFMRINGLGYEGISIRSEHTHYNELVYAPDGQYIEYSIYGEAFSARNWPALAVTPEDIERHLPGAKGMYCFLKDEGDFCDRMRALHDKYDFKLMWEIPPRLDTSHCDWFLKTLEFVDIYSLNRPESFALFGVDSEEAAVERIREIGVPCYYRVGQKGAYMIMGGEVHFVPVVHLVPAEEEVDPTGCGNCSTAAAMWAFTEGYDPLMICILANISAAYNVKQYGPLIDMSEEVRAEACALAEQMYRQRKSEER